jgi:hypothetical protein
MEIVESHLAEVLWFAGENPQDDPTTPGNEAIDGAGNRIEPGMRRIYRRVFLIAPHLGPWANHPENVSCRWDGMRWVANTLGDLSKRENRVERRVNSGSVEPYPHPISGMGSSSNTDYLMLNDALAFDIRVFDAGAPLLNAPGGTVVQPGDLYWPKAAAGITSQSFYAQTVAGFGAYVDLGWAYQRGSANPANLYWPPGGQATVSAPLKMPAGLALPTAALFAVPHQPGWHPRNRVRLSGYPAVYDTWSFHYENNGLDEDNLDQDNNVLTGADEGTNGLDDPVRYDTPLNVDSNRGASSPTAAYGVDDAGERETSPPYDAPLRGVKISLRVYERDARQIREVSVTHAFVP